MVGKKDKHSKIKANQWTKNEGEDKSCPLEFGYGTCLGWYYQRRVQLRPQGRFGMVDSSIQ